MPEFPEELAETLDDFSFITDRNERAEYLIEIADRFSSVKVPEEISTPPYSEEHHVQFCESEAYVWAIDQPDGTQRYYFDVLNPQGLSAMAMSVILGETLSGKPPEKVAEVPTDIVFKIFGKEIAMGKGQGLMGIVSMVKNFARQKLENRAS
jgi:cysteine desulfuration protein SufE